jgi:hypothetical protein
MVTDGGREERIGTHQNACAVDLKAEWRYTRDWQCLPGHLRQSALHGKCEGCCNLT